MTRILFHCASLRGGGAERVIVLIANEMASRGHEVVLLTWNAGGPNAALLDRAVKLIDLNLTIRGESYGKPATLRGLGSTVQVLRRFKPEAVVSGPEFANLIMAVALTIARSRARFYPSFHAATALPSKGLGAKLAIFLSRFVSWRTTNAIAVSAGVGRDLLVRGFADTQIRVIHNPVPAPSRQRTEYVWETALAGMGQGPVIVTVGRLVPVKDHRTLLQAFALLTAGRPARLVIFGEGPLEAELRAHAESLGIAGQVLFAGYINDPPACYRAANLSVLSSRSEGFGNVLVESMAAGVPVVSTDAPYGPREILGDGQFGSLVPVGDPFALAEAMAKMLDAPTAPSVLTTRADDFSMRMIGDAYESVLS